MSFVTARRLASLGCGLLLAACGGSGSQSSNPAPVPTATRAATATSPSVPATPTPTAPAPPTPRGEKVVAAAAGIGIIREIPGGPVVGAAPRMPAQYSVPDPEEVQVETAVTGLQVPWSLQFAPDGRLFITERPGRVRIVADGHLDPTPWGTLPVLAVGEGGLMGLALSPDFPSDPWVYVCYTFDAGGIAQNRISRVREVAGRAGAEEILLDGFPGAVVHNGCRLKFGPDRKLYATTGDATQRSQAQDLGSLAGKILRLNPDGSVPADNPFGPDSPVYTYGHRNPQGLAFHPQTGVLFETEHGPSGEVGFGAYDEVNIIVPGANYGWPLAVGAPHLAQFRDPLLSYPEAAVPPGGATFYLSRLIPQWTGNFFFASLGAQHLQRVVLDGDGHVVTIERLFAGIYGRLRDVIEGPDGALWVSTSNRDGRGTPVPDDDRILRIVRAPGR
jgi:glucose/arabinose dehydrogenase